MDLYDLFLRNVTLRQSYRVTMTAGTVHVGVPTVGSLRTSRPRIRVSDHFIELRFEDLVACVPVK
jgi:hypothetical protein